MDREAFYQLFDKVMQELADHQHWCKSRGFYKGGDPVDLSKTMYLILANCDELSSAAHYILADQSERM